MWEAEVEVRLFWVGLSLDYIIHTSDGGVKEGNQGRMLVNLPRENAKIVEVSPEIIPLSGALWEPDCKDVINEVLIVK